MSTSFWIIIAAQMAVYLSLAKAFKVSPFSTKRWVTALLTGLVVGIGFDSLFSYLGFFTYIPTGSPQALYYTHLTIAQLITNGLLSYGIAALTGVVVFSTQTTPASSCLRKLQAPLSIALLLFLGLAIVLHSTPLLSLICYGVATLLTSELLILSTNTTPLITGALIEGQWKPLLTFYGASVYAALLYEITNYFFPFWVWLPVVELPHALKEILVIAAGYFALIYLLTAACNCVYNAKNREKAR